MDGGGRVEKDDDECIDGVDVTDERWSGEDGRVAAETECCIPREGGGDPCPPPDARRLSVE